MVPNFYVFQQTNDLCTAKVGSGEHQTFVQGTSNRSPDLAQVGATSETALMLWNRPIGPESKEAAILRRFMQEAIGNELRSQYEPSTELPRDLHRLVHEIDEQRE